jgi:hypothetical protein
MLFRSFLITQFPISVCEPGTQFDQSGVNRQGSLGIPHGARQVIVDVTMLDP